MSGLFVSQSPFLYQIWPDLERNQDSADRHGELLRPLTHSCFLLHLLGRLFLLALPLLIGICLPSLWSPVFSLFFRSVPPLFRQVVALSHLDSPSHNLLFWTDHSVPFPFGKGGSGILANCSLLALRPLFLFRQTQYVQVFPLKPAPFFKLFAGLSNTNRYAISLLLLSDSRSVLVTLSSPPSFLLPQTLWQEMFFLSYWSIRLQWVPEHSFLPRNDAANELVRRGALLAPSTIPCCLSPLIFRMHSSFFLDWRRTVSSKFFATQVPSISTEELALLRHTRCVVSRLRCNGHSLLLSCYLFRISRIENPSYSACGHSCQDASHSALSSYGLFAPLALWRLSVSLRSLVPTLGSYQASGAPWSSAMPPSLERGRVINNNKT